MNHWLVILPALPVLIPLLAGVCLLFARRWQRGQETVAVLALALNLTAAVALLASTCGGGDAATGRLSATRVLVSQMGNWPAPFGITIAIDTLAAALLVIAGFVALCAFVFTITQAPASVTAGYFHPLYQFLILGVNWAFITGDLFNLFVSFEIALLCSYVLLVAGTTARQMRHAYKYIVLNIFASTIFAAACGWIYGTLGTLNLAELTRLSATGQVSGSAALATAVLVFVFATKAALLPMWFWLPDTYPTLPPGLGALYAALLTKVGVYAMLRIVVMCFSQAEGVAPALQPALLFSAGATMVLGGLGMASAASLRRLLACGILIGVGYMVTGLAYALHTAKHLQATAEAAQVASAADGVAGTVFYMAQHMLIIAALLLCADVILRYSRTDDMHGMGGIVRRDLPLAVLFFIAGLSLVGLPPTSGMFGKYLLIRASFGRLDEWGWIMGLLIIATSGLTLLAIVRVWTMAFWSKAPADKPHTLEQQPSRGWVRAAAMVPIWLLVGFALTMGLMAQRFHHVAVVAAQGIIDPDAYVTAVLGKQTLPNVPEVPGSEGAP